VKKSRRILISQGNFRKSLVRDYGRLSKTAEIVALFEILQLKNGQKRAEDERPDAKLVSCMSLICINLQAIVPEGFISGATLGKYIRLFVLTASFFAQQVNT